MVYTCFSCKWRSDKHPRRSYHKFPSNDELKQKWLDILGKSNVSIGTRTSLCSLHFKEDCFRYGLVNGRRILKDGSLPTLHLTKGDIEGQTIDLVHEMKLPESSIENSLPMPHLTTGDIQMKDPTSELEVEDNLVEVPVKICSLKGLCRKSGSLNIPYKEDEIRRLKKKIVTLKRSVKRLRHSKHKMKIQLAEFKMMIRKYEADNRLVHVSMITGKTRSKMKKKI